MLNEFRLEGVVQAVEEIDDYIKLCIGQDMESSVCVYLINNQENLDYSRTINVGNYVKTRGYLKVEPQNVMVYAIAYSIKKWEER